MGKIVAIGGYEYHGRDDAVIKTPIVIDREIVKLSGKKKPKVLFVPTASSDSERYRRAISNLYHGKLECVYDELLLIAEKPSKKEITQKIQFADIIYVGGGNTLMMMKKFRRLGVDKLLKRAYKDGKVLCGVSAGSMCWFEYGISDSLQFYDKKTTKYIRVTCLGILPGTNNPHFGSLKYDKGYRTKGMKEIMKRTKGLCFAVPDACAVAFVNGKMRVLGNEKVSKAWWENGKYFVEEV